jgi:diaminopimelate decarboxylase
MNLNFKIIDQLSKEHGDSFYLLDSAKFRNNFNDLLGSFQNYYHKTIIGYSYKTNYTPHLCSIVNELSGYAEVVSEMEYDLAIKVGVDPCKIIVNGPYQTKSGLIKYFRNGSLVNLDSLYEIDILKEISNEVKDCLFRVGLRCNFRLTNQYISRFGFDIDSLEFSRIFSDLETISNVKVEGLHCHFPDRVLDLFEVRVSKMLKTAQSLFKTPPKFIDIGGGYFGKMPPFLASQFNCMIPSYNDYAKTVAGAFHEFYRNVPEKLRPVLVIEPGSALVADTIKFVARVIDIKRVGEKYIALTSGSRFNMGAFASTLIMPLEVFPDPDASDLFYDCLDISGFTCIESDYLYKNYKGVIGKNSFLVFSNVGSYSLVFKPPFILPNFPLIEFVNGEENKIIKRKENLYDIFDTYKF